jgi:hypothetical protein
VSRDPASHLLSNAPASTPVIAQAKVDVTHVSLSELGDASRLVRSPMTAEEISALRGVVAYAIPSSEEHGLRLRLADGSWVRVTPADEEREFYLIEPADDTARRVGLQPQFLALWAAYRYIGRCALAALERSVLAGEDTALPPMLGVEVIEVHAIDHRMPAIELLERLAQSSGADRQGGALSLVGDLIRG